MNQLTKAEEQIMQILWKIELGFVHDILDQMPAPKPAYTTVSTIVRTLIKKGFVGYKAYGKTHEYHALISKDTYSQFFLNKMLKGYFSGSIQNLVSFFVKENDFSVQQLDELLSKIKENLKENKS